MGAQRTGVIYLLHFEKPYRHARHYLGFSSDVDRRLLRHQAGAGARLVQVVREAGIGFILVKQWRGTRNDERRLKTRSHVPELCPLCAGGDLRQPSLTELPCCSVPPPAIIPTGVFS